MGKAKDTFINFVLRHVTDEHERIQKSTFTKWMNYHLETHSSASKIEDLFVDIRDGVLLCKLLEVLTGEALPVNMSRTPKRVHFLANILTALTVLKKRGLDLVNNNASDVADGKPSIVLGLVWQIILHFQIETNLQMIRESTGVDIMTPTTSRLSTLKRNIREGLTPLGDEDTISDKSPAATPSKKGSSFRSKFFNTGSSNKRNTQTSVDVAMLRWVKDTIGDGSNGVIINDFDRSWRDGLGFLALINKYNNTLIDMEKAKKRTPRENIKDAFELAEKYMGIKPLLEVDDVLCDKPDRRSMIIYISYFMAVFERRERDRINIDKGDRISTSSMRTPSKRIVVKIVETKEYNEMIIWIEKIIKEIENDNNKKKGEVDIFKGYNKYHELRKMFIENRETFELIRSHRKELAPESWRDIEGKWKLISENIHERSIVLEKQLPEPLSSIHYWLTVSENLVNYNFNFEKTNNSDNLKMINRMIEKIMLHYSNYNTHCDRFKIVYESGKAEKKVVNREFLEKMKGRLENAKNDYNTTLEGLLLLQGHYRILTYIEELNNKMDLWRAADSVDLVNRWLKEYRLESAKMPERVINDLLDDYRGRISKTNKKERENAFKFLTDAQDASNILIERFSSMREILETLLKYWMDFEDNVVIFDKHLEELEASNATSLNNDATLCLERIDNIGNSISEQSAAPGRAAIAKRLEEIHRRIKFKSKKIPPVGGRLVVDLTIEPSSSRSVTSEKSSLSPSTYSMKSPNLPKLKFSSDSNMAKLKESPLYRYIQRTRVLLSQRCDNSPDLEDLLSDLNKSQQELILYEEMKNNSLESLTKSDKKELNIVFSSIKSKLPCKIERIEEILPKVKAIESYLEQLIDWCHTHNPSSPMGKLSINERSGVLLTIDNMLTILEKSENIEIFDTRNLRKNFLRIKNKFKDTEREAIEKAINDIEKAKEEGIILEDSISKEKIKTIKEKLRNTTIDDLNSPNENRINDLLRRKEEIINRKEKSLQEVKNSILEIDMINEAIGLHLNGKYDERVEDIEGIWLKKKNELNNLKLNMEALDEIEKSIMVEGKIIILDRLYNDVNEMKEKIKSNTFYQSCPIGEETKERVGIICNLIKEKHRLACESIYQDLMERLEKIDYTVEEDLPVAEVVINAIAQEAEGLYRHEPKDSYSHTKRENLLKKTVASKELINRKMEFFKRLQHLYDGISHIRQQNINWNSIKLSEVENVEHDIETALNKIQNEYEKDVEFLSTEIENIQGNFFQLECDRVKEKFRLLVSQLCLIGELLKNRKVFLSKFHELTRFADTCEININEMISLQAQKNMNEDNVKSPILLDSKELNEMFTALEMQVDDVITAQHLAQMIIEDYTPENLIGNLRITAGTDNISKDTINDSRLLKIDALVTKLKIILGNDVNDRNVNNITWTETYKFIQNHIRDGLEEQGLIGQLESQIKDISDVNKYETIINIYKKQLEERDKMRNDLIDDALGKFIAHMFKEFRRIDKDVDKNIAADDYETIKKLEEGDWREWKILISDIEKLVNNSYCIDVNDKYRDDFVDFEHNAFTLDKKLSQFKKEKEDALSKQGKLIKRLPAFGRWLELAEEDIDSISNMNDSISPSEKVKNLTQMKDKFIYHMPLVKKLEKLPLNDPEQRKIADQYCTKYRYLLDKLNAIDIPDAHYIPIKVEFDKIATPESTLSERDFKDMQEKDNTGRYNNETPTTSTYDDIDTELTSVEHELSSLEYMKPTTSTGVTQKGINDSVESHIDKMTSMLLQIYNGIDMIRTYYAIPSLKPLPEAIVDYEQLVEYTNKMRMIADDLEKIKDHSGVTPLLETLHEQIRATGATSEAMKKEIDDEKDLQKYSNEIMNGLREFEDKVKIAKENPNQVFDSNEVDQTLHRLGEQISELKRRYNQKRYFVISSLHGSGVNSPNRRKKVVMKITQTVTTIIKVIEQGQESEHIINRDTPYIITDEELQMLRNQLKELEDMLQQGEVMAKKSSREQSTSYDSSRLPSEEMVVTSPTTGDVYETITTETVTRIESDDDNLATSPFTDLEDGTVVEIVTEKVIEIPTIQERIETPDFEIIDKEDILEEEVTPEKDADDEGKIKEQINVLNDIIKEKDRLDAIISNLDKDNKKQSKNRDKEHKAIVAARKVVYDNAKAYEAAKQAEKERLLAEAKAKEEGSPDETKIESLDYVKKYEDLTKAIENLEQTIANDDESRKEEELRIIDKAQNAIIEYEKLNDTINDIDNKNKEDIIRRERDVIETKLAQKAVLDNGMKELADREMIRNESAERLAKEAEEAKKSMLEDLERQKELDDNVEKLRILLNETPLDYEVMDKIRKYISLLPEDYPNYQELKKKAEDTEDKYNNIKEIQLSLNDINKSLGHLVEEPQDNVPLAEIVSSTQDKLEMLRNQVTPKLETLTLFGIEEVKNDIDNAQEQLNNVMDKLENRLTKDKKKLGDSDNATYCIMDLSKLSDEAYLPVDISKPDEAKENLNILLKKIDDKLEELQSIPTDELPQDIKENIENAKINAKKDIEKINNNIENLNKHKDLTLNLIDNKSKLLDNTNKQAVDADELIKRYSEAPQPYETSINDLQNIVPTINTLNDLLNQNEELLTLLIENQLPNEDIVNTINDIKPKIDALHLLKDKLRSDLEKENDLITKKNDLIKIMNGIISKSNDILGKEPNLEELDSIQKEIGDLQTALDAALDHSEVPLQVVNHSPASDIWELKDRLDENKLFDVSSILLPELDNELNKLSELPGVEELKNKLTNEKVALGNDIIYTSDNINRRIQDIEKLNSLIDGTDKKLNRIIEELDTIPSYDYERILAIEYDDYLPLNTVPQEITMLSNEANKKHIPEINNVLDKINLVGSKMSDKKRQAEEAIEAQRKAAEEFAKAEKQAAEELAEAERKTAEELRNTENKINELIAAPLNEDNVKLIDEQLSKIPEGALLHVELKKKADDIKSKVEKVKSVKLNLDDIQNDINTITYETSENVSLEEQIKTTKDNLEKIILDLKPRIYSIAWTDISEIDEEIKKKQQDIEDLEKSLEAKLSNDKDKLENLESAIADIDKLSKEYTEAPTQIDTSKPKESMNYLAALLKNLQDKLNALKSIPIDNLPESDKKKIQDAIEAAEKENDKINKDIDNLNKEQEFQDGLLKNKSLFIEKVPLDLVEANELLKRYSEAPQPYESSLIDIQNIQPMITKLNNLIIDGEETAKLLGEKDLPYEDVVTLLNDVAPVISSLQLLENKIKEDIDKEKNLIDRKSQLDDEIKNIINKFNDVLSKDSTPEDLSDVQKSISELQNKLDSALDDNEVPLAVVQHSSKSDVWDLKDRLDEIALALNEQKEDARKKMELQKLASDISSKVKEIQNEIENAEKVESNPDSSIDDLTKASDDLKNIQSNLLPKLEEDFNMLPATPEVDNLRNKTFEEKVKLEEDLGNVESAINERIDSISKLNDLISTCDNKLNNVIDKINNEPVHNMDSILKIEYEDTLPLNGFIEEILDVADCA
uniref:Calponin-homology (CH) domain-containing protein n=1 Tax=Parastrongyloides trichosuri TaxID=131310 RepID=A0A0N4Z7F2_PARTI